MDCLSSEDLKRGEGLIRSVYQRMPNPAVVKPEMFALATLAGVTAGDFTVPHRQQLRSNHRYWTP
jgi:hypothetical protein